MNEQCDGKLDDNVVDDNNNYSYKNGDDLCALVSCRVCKSGKKPFPKSSVQADIATE